MRRIAIGAVLMLCTSVFADESPTLAPVPDPISTPCAEEFADYQSAQQDLTAADMFLYMVTEFLGMAEQDLNDCQNNGGDCSSEEDAVEQWSNAVEEATENVAAFQEILDAAEAAYADCCDDEGVGGPPGGLSSFMLAALVAMPFMS